MSKPVIGISGSIIIDDGGMFPGYHRSYVNDDYIDSVVKNGGVPYIIPFNEDDDVIKEQLEHVQGLILSGGHDVDPSFYGEEPMQKIGTTWPQRDHFDMRLLKLAEEKGIPVLGICRGMQIINVFHGGTLYQDLSYREVETLKHNQGRTPDQPTHSVLLDEDSKIAKILGEIKFRVNSFHHQIIRDVAPEFNVSGKSPDGVVEAIESSNKNVIAVQWHPEMLHNNKSVAFMNNLFKWVIDNAK